MADSILTLSADSQRVAFAFMGAAQVSNIYIWDLPGKRIQPLTQASQAGLPSDSFGSPELVRFPTFDQNADGTVREIPAWFYRPTQPANERAPAIIVVHGGPELQYRPFFSFFVQFFLNHGYAVLAPNVRGSAGYGKAYSHLDDVEKRMDSVADLAHAAYWLKAQPEIDSDRIVVYGGSYGGFMVLAALTTYPDLWAAGVDIVGISNFVTFLENTSAYRRAHRESEYGSLAKDRDFLQRISPLNHADKIKAPLIVIHGANDPRVPLGEAKQLVDVLHRQGNTVEFLVFDDEGHGLVKLKNKLIAYPAIVAFLDKHIGQ